MGNGNISIQHLNLFFGAKHVLKNINLEIPEQSITALIGPSGCGKSTLLRSINRMHDFQPDVKISGQILLDNFHILHPATNPVHVRQRIGMVFQKPNPFPKSIFENIAYGLKINKLKPKVEIPEIVEKSLKESSLWDEVKESLHTSALQLSGGQQQRLCIARAIALRPKVLLLDEPCSALDPISTIKIEELLLELKQEFTIVIVTHNMQQALRVADMTAFMYLGELIEFGKTSDIFYQPQHELTRNYVSGHFG